MGDVVNLRMARKRKARADREAEAARNRAAHGVNRDERTVARALKDRADRALEGHKRQGKEPADGDT